MTSPQPYPQPVQPVHYRNGFGITALVLMLVGAVFTLMPITGLLAVILGGLAILFGLLGWGRVRRGEANNRTMSVLSVIFGAIVTAGGTFGVYLFFQAFDELDRNLKDLDANLSAPEPAAAAPYAETVEPEPTPGRPTLKDIVVDLKITSQQCYGYGMGCDLTVEPQFTYNGNPASFEAYTCDITYEITGGNTGKVLETATSYGPENVEVYESFVTSNDGNVSAKTTELSCY